MQTFCITCEGRGKVVNARMAVSGKHVGTDHSVDRCPTCRGRGSYNWLTGPGVDHEAVHGTGRQPE